MNTISRATTMTVCTYYRKYTIDHRTVNSTIYVLKSTFRMYMYMYYYRYDVVIFIVEKQQVCSRSPEPRHCHRCTIFYIPYDDMHNSSSTKFMYCTVRTNRNFLNYVLYHFTAKNME